VKLEMSRCWVDSAVDYMERLMMGRRGRDQDSTELGWIQGFKRTGGRASDRTDRRTTRVYIR
jgi:hypothetical protein